MNFKGIAVVGRGRAKTLGFSTINLKVIGAIEIPDGVYGVKVKIHFHDFIAAMHVGNSPTFDDGRRTVELHLIGIKEKDVKEYQLNDLSGVTVEVETLQYLRQILKFNSKEELIKQIGVDVNNVLELVDTIDSAA